MRYFFLLLILSFSTAYAEDSKESKLNSLTYKMVYEANHGFPDEKFKKDLIATGKTAQQRQTILQSLNTIRSLKNAFTTFVYDGNFCAQFFTNLHCWKSAGHNKVQVLGQSESFEIDINHPPESFVKMKKKVSLLELLLPSAFAEGEPTSSQNRALLKMMRDLNVAASQEADPQWAAVRASNVADITALNNLNKSFMIYTNQGWMNLEDATSSVVSDVAHTNFKYQCGSRSIDVNGHKMKLSDTYAYETTIEIPGSFIHTAIATSASPSTVPVCEGDDEVKSIFGLNAEKCEMSSAYNQSSSLGITRCNYIEARCTFHSDSSLVVEKCTSNDIRPTCTKEVDASLRLIDDELNGLWASVATAKLNAPQGSENNSHSALGKALKAYNEREMAVKGKLLRKTVLVTELEHACADPELRRSVTEQGVQLLQPTTTR